MKCWICLDTTKNICCSCNNDYKYAHKYCIYLLSIIYNKKYCLFCKQKYKICYLFYIIYNIYYFLYLISKYDIINGNEWDKY